GLAQALLGAPAVLRLDEPTAGLDPGQIQEAREVIRAFGDTHAVLFSTHILAEVTLICRRVAIINHGRLLAIDTPSGLQRALEETHRVSLQVSGPAADIRAELRAVKGVISVDIHVMPGQSEMVAVDCQVEPRQGVEAEIARAITRRWGLHRLQRQAPAPGNHLLRDVATP